jgi:hypothetical protein
MEHIQLPPTGSGEQTVYTVVGSEEVPVGCSSLFESVALVHMESRARTAWRTSIEQFMRGRVSEQFDYRDHDILKFEGGREVIPPTIDPPPQLTSELCIDELQFVGLLAEPDGEEEHKGEEGEGDKYWRYTPDGSDHSELSGIVDKYRRRFRKCKLSADKLALRMLTKLWNVSRVDCGSIYVLHTCLHRFVCGFMSLTLTTVVYVAKPCT